MKRFGVEIALVGFALLGSGLMGCNSEIVFDSPVSQPPATTPPVDSQPPKPGRGKPVQPPSSPPGAILSHGDYVGPSRLLYTSAQGVFGIMDTGAQGFPWVVAESGSSEYLDASCSGEWIFRIAGSDKDTVEVHDPNDGSSVTSIQVPPGGQAMAALDLGPWFAIASHNANRIVIVEESGAPVASVATGTFADEDGIAEAVALASYDNHLYVVLRGYNRTTKTFSGSKLLEVEPINWTVTRSLDLQTMDPTRGGLSSGAQAKSPAVMVHDGMLYLSGRRRFVNKQPVGHNGVERIDLASFQTAGWLFQAPHDNGHMFGTISMSKHDHTIWAFAGNDQMHGVWLRGYHTDGTFSLSHIQGGSMGDWPRGRAMAVDQNQNFWMDGVYLQQSFMAGLLYIPADTKTVAQSWTMAGNPQGSDDDWELAMWETTGLTSCHAQ